MRRGLVLVVVLVALSLAAATGLADATFPELDVYSLDQTLGSGTDLSLDVILLAGGAGANTVAITVPTGYAANLTQATGTELGEAEVDFAAADAAGTSAKIQGKTVVADPAAFAANPLAEACAPGAHTATWSLDLDDSTSLPIAVDAVTTGGSYRITLCVNALPHPDRIPVDLFFVLNSVFRNPTAARTYWWSALVTPTDATGAGNPAAAYELQGGEPLPEPLSIRPTWDARHHVLTVRGALAGGGAPRSAINVHLLAGSTSNPDTMREIGATMTTRAGTYVFRQHRAKKPSFLYAHVNFYHYDRCSQPSTAPAGCASSSIDGTDSATVKTH